MKKFIVSCFSVLAVAAFLLPVSSCDKGGSHYPKIGFWVDTGSAPYAQFENQSATVPHDTLFSLYPNASRTGTEGLLRTFKIYRSTNASADSVIASADIHTTNFIQRYHYQAGDSGQVDKYTFTITNDEGLSDTVSYTITAR